MKQYRFTTANFSIQGDDGLTEDTVMDSADLARIKQLAGIVSEDMVPKVPQTYETGLVSPLTSNFEEKRKIEREKNIRPGSEEWFKLWGRKDMPNLPNKS